MIEYLGYLCIHERLKPLPQKIQTLQALQPSINALQLQMILGIVQYCQDTWQKISRVFVLLADLVRECGCTKMNNKKDAKKKTFHWELVYQQELEKMKQLINHYINLAYPYF